MNQFYANDGVLLSNGDQVQRGSFWSPVGDLLIGVAICANFMPTFMLNDPTMRFYDIPFHYYAFSLGTLAILLETTTRLHFSKLALGAFACFLFLLFLGLFRDNELRWMLTDMVVFGALVAGLAWASMNRVVFIANYFKAIALIGLLLYPINLVATGNVQFSLLESKNVVWLPFWCITSYLAFTLPFVYACGLTYSSPASMRWVKVLTAATLMCGLYTAFLTSNRTVVGQTVGSVLVTLTTVSAKSIRLTAILFLSTIISYCGVLLFSDTVDNLISTFTTTDLCQKFLARSVFDDPRFYELQQLYDHMEGRHVLGLGFGSRYDFILRYADRDVEVVTALAPHLGAFAFYQKGGIVLYILFIFVPFVLSLRYLLFPANIPLFRKGAWCGIFCYILFFSVTTGGWDFVYTFMYGALLAVAVQSGDSRAHFSEPEFRMS